MLKNLSLFLLAFFLISCSKVEQSNGLAEDGVTVAVVTNKGKQSTKGQIPPLYKQRTGYIRGLRQWKITGAIAIKEGSEGWQARLIWRESPNDFSGRLYAYFSPEQVVIKGNQNRVQLIDGKGHVYRERSMERMLKKSTGWYIPMDFLRYWVRGLFVPGQNMKATFDDEARLKTLQQSGWTLNYQSYANISGYILPKKITLSRGPLRIRFVISKWAV